MVFALTRKALVVQSNRLVEAKYRLSVEEQKIIKILISQIQKEDEDFKEYEFRINELATLLGMEHSNTYGVLRAITKKLLTRVLEFYNPENNTLLQASWLSSAEYKIGEGTVSMCFDPKLKPLLLQLKSYFTKYELGKIMQFRGQYTIRFFELRKSFLGRNKADVVFSLKELRETMGLQKAEYQQFCDFKKRVLEPARIELLEKTGQSFDWEPIKRGRGGMIVGVHFVFHNGTETEPEAGPDESLLPLFDLPKESPKTAPSISQELIDLLLNNGLSPTLINELILKYEEPYLREKIALADNHPELVKNKAGFLVSAIQEDWKDAELEEKKRQEEARKKERERERRELRLRAIKQNFELHRKNHALSAYEQFSPSVHQQFRKEFLDSLTGVLRQRYQDRVDFGFEDAFYRSFLMQQKLSPLPLEEYLRQTKTVLTPEDLEIMKRL